MLYVPSLGMDFGWTEDNQGGRPNSNMGTTVTATANNTMGSWNRVLDALDYDTCGILLCLNSASSSGATRPSLIDIGVDQAGGSAYSVKIPYLMSSNAGSFSSVMGIFYFFPLKIKAGSTVAARGQNSTGSNISVRVFARVFGRPRHPEMIKTGAYVDYLGVNPSTSLGVSVTPGDTTIGNWTEIGTTTRAAWWWQAGMSINNSNMTLLNYSSDFALGDASNKDIIIPNLFQITDTSERVAQPLAMYGCERKAPAGTKIYGRSWCAGTPDSGANMGAWALGG